MERARVALRPLFRFLGAPMTKRTRRYFSNRMTLEEANKERWREGISRAQGGAARGALRRGGRAARGRRRALRAASAPLARARRTPRSTRWSTSTIVGPDERRPPTAPRAGRARLRRRHRAQRHPHPLLPARPPLALSRGADRVPLPLQPQGARRRRPRRHRPGGVPAQAARLLVAPGADRRPRLRAGEVAGARPRARPRPAHDHRPDRFEEAAGRFERDSRRRPASGVADAVLRPAAAPRRARPASRCWSRCRASRSPPPTGSPGSSPRRASCTRCATGATRGRRRSRCARSPTTRPTSPRGSSSGPTACARPRRACAGSRRRIASACSVISLDELVQSDREATYAELLGFLGVADEPRDARVLRRPR